MDKQVIHELVYSQQEGAYWDFKKEWYSQHKKADLLHDIICMANNLEGKEAYIIIGIDEENNYRPVGIAEDVNRKNTQNIVDFLRDKSFAGHIRPTVLVESILFDGKEVDVIIIKNSYSTPFYLTANYQGVYANNIYTRVMDTNTPKVKSADLHHVEYLWRKRFRLTSSPIDQIEFYLEKPDEWNDVPTDWQTVKKYHKNFPEFTIEYTLDDDGDAYQYYLFNQTDITPHWRTIRIHYHQTLLRQFEAVCLDGGRYFTPVPESDGISLGEFHNWDITFRYFIIGSLRYKIHQFYYEPDGDEETMSRYRFHECVLIFESEMEKEDFKGFAKRSWERKEDFAQGILLPYFEEVKGYKMTVIKEQYFNVQILKKMFEEFINLRQGEG